MSSYFNIVCLDCKCGMFTHETKSIDQELQDIVDNKGAYLALYGLQKSGIDLNIRVSGEAIDLEWLYEHRDHRLAVSFDLESWEDIEERTAAGNPDWWDYWACEKGRLPGGK